MKAIKPFATGMLILAFIIAVRIFVRKDIFYNIYIIGGGGGGSCNLHVSCK